MMTSHPLRSLMIVLVCSVASLISGCINHNYPSSSPYSKTYTKSYYTSSTTKPTTQSKYHTTPYYQPTSYPPIAKPIVYNQLPPFDAIDVHGPAKVIINHNSRGPAVTIKGAPPGTLPIPPVLVDNRTLMINSRNQPVVVIVNTTQPLRSITVHDSASVWANNVNSPGLVVSTMDNSAVHLNHAGALRMVQNNSSQDMAISGIDSRSIVVYGYGTGRVRLSGKTRSLEAKLGDQFCLEAQDLHADTVHIMTHDKALAYICPIHAMYAFAYDNSNIYYYLIPGQLVRETRISGNVLKLN